MTGVRVPRGARTGGPQHAVQQLAGFDQRGPVLVELESPLQQLGQRDHPFGIGPMIHAEQSAVHLDRLPEDRRARVAGRTVPQQSGEVVEPHAQQRVVVGARGDPFPQHRGGRLFPRACLLLVAGWPGRRGRAQHAVAVRTGRQHLGQCRGQLAEPLGDTVIASGQQRPLTGDPRDEYRRLVGIAAAAARGQSGEHRLGDVDRVVVQCGPGREQPVAQLHQRPAPRRVPDGQRRDAPAQQPDRFGRRVAVLPQPEHDGQQQQAQRVPGVTGCAVGHRAPGQPDDPVAQPVRPHVRLPVQRAEQRTGRRGQLVASQRVDRPGPDVAAGLLEDGHRLVGELDRPGFDEEVGQAGQQRAPARGAADRAGLVGRAQGVDRGVEVGPHRSAFVPLDADGAAVDDALEQAGVTRIAPPYRLGQQHHDRAVSVIGQLGFRAVVQVAQQPHRVQDLRVGPVGRRQAAEELVGVPYPLDRDRARIRIGTHGPDMFLESAQQVVVGLTSRHGHPIEGVRVR